jgi:hypothetical protein
MSSKKERQLSRRRNIKEELGVKRNHERFQIKVTKHR